MAGRSTASPPPAHLGRPCHDRPPLTPWSPPAAVHAPYQQVRGVNRRHRPRADLAETGHEESNGAGQTAGRSRLPRTAWRRHRRDQPLDRRERREGSLPARLAGGQRPVRYRHAARQESIGGYESPPGGTRPARARHRAAEDAAAYRPTEATVQAPAVRAARAARQQQPPSSDDLGQRRRATPARPDDRTPVLTIAPGLRSDHGDVRQRVGPMAGHQRVNKFPTCPVADTADRRLRPLGPTDGDRRCVAPLCGCCRPRTR